MLRYTVRRLLTLVLTMLIVSMVVFGVVEIAPGNVVRNILGAYATPEQEKSQANQLGFDRPIAIRYISWLLGTDWQASPQVGRPLKEIHVSQGTVTNFAQWWAVDTTGELVRWTVEKGQLTKNVRQPDGTIRKVPDEGAWHSDTQGKYFWGVDDANHAALWRQGQGGTEYRLEYSGWIQKNDAPVEYIPLTKGLVRGDAGVSLMYKRPVNEVIGRKIAYSGILALLAFVLAMPLGVLLGLVAGLNEGKPIDRIMSLNGLVTAASPDFATGIFLIMIFSLWLKVLPGAVVLSSDSALLSHPEMLILPVLTAGLVEVGYIMRITRASVVEVVSSNYVRTAILKGLPYRSVVLHHILRNSMLAPVTVIMLHINWLIGGLVVVESVFGYPGMGRFILEAALYKDVYSIEAGAMVLILLAVGTQLIADILYSVLNPRIRYS